MAGMFSRIIKQYVEDIVVNKLSDNKTIQNLAVKGVETTKQMGETLKDPSAVAKFATDIINEIKRQAAEDMKEYKNNSNDSSSSSSSKTALPKKSKT